MVHYLLATCELISNFISDFDNYFELTLNESDFIDFIYILSHQLRVN